MLYSAICLDTSAYFEKGTIKVRIFEYYSVPRRMYDSTKKKTVATDIDNLSKTPKELEIGDEASLDSGGSSADFEALVYAPLGGGRNYGMFALPKTNEKGVVSFLDGMFSKPIWMGSYFEPIYKRDGDKGLDFNTVEFVNAPNEDPDTEGEGSDLAKDGAENTTLSDTIKGDQNTIILRTKTTEPNATDGTKMDFEDTTNVSTENLIAIDSKKVRVRHFTQWSDATLEKYQELMIYKDEDNSDKETIRLEVNNVADTKRSYVEITEDGFNFFMNNDGDETKFKLGVSEESDSIYFEDKDGNTIIGDGTGLFVNGDEDSVVLYSDLKDILEQLMEHIHIGAVPTKGPLTTKKAPLQYKKQMTDMEAALIKSNHER